MPHRESELVQTLAGIPPAENISLVLPFTLSILLDPTPLLATIYQTAIALPTAHFSVLFTTPIDNDVPVEQLYDALRRDPRANWDVFQRFLAEVYAALSAGQWAAEKVLLSVEVGFAGGDGSQEKRIGKESDVVLYLEGYESLISSSIQSSIPTHSLPSPALPSSSSPSLTPPAPLAGPDVVALGGTFDHLHAAHKLLLHLAHFLARRKVIVGVMSDTLLNKKAYREYLQPTSERIQNVRRFMLGLPQSPDGTQMELDIVEIFDAFGPTQDDLDIQALVISDETRSGGQAVNDLRNEKGLGELEVWCIGVISAGSGAWIAQEAVEGKGRSERKGSEEPGSTTSTGSGILQGLDEKTLKEVKMGSTAIRKWLHEGGGNRAASR